MIALGGPTLKRDRLAVKNVKDIVSMIALGGPTLKPELIALCQDPNPESQ